MDKEKVIRLLKELVNEIAPGTIPENPQVGDITIGTRGDLQKVLDEIKAQEAQNPTVPTEEDIRKMIETEIQKEKYGKRANKNKPYWMYKGKDMNIYNDWKGGQQVII